MRLTHERTPTADTGISRENTPAIDRLEFGTARPDEVISSARCSRGSARSMIASYAREGSDSSARPHKASYDNFTFCAARSHLFVQPQRAGSQIPPRRWLQAKSALLELGGGEPAGTRLYSASAVRSKVCLLQRVIGRIFVSKCELCRAPERIAGMTFRTRSGSRAAVLRLSNVSSAGPGGRALGSSFVTSAFGAVNALQYFAFEPLSVLILCSRPGCPRPSLSHLLKLHRLHQGASAFRLLPELRPLDPFNSAVTTR